MDNLLLDPEDHFYGGGEKFTRLDHVGRTIRIWNRNPYGARSELAYKNIPLAGRKPGLRPLRRRPDRRDVPPGQPLEPDLHGRGRRPRARLLRARRHAEGDPGGLHRPHRQAARPARVGLRALGLDLLREVHRGIGAGRGAAPPAGGDPLRRLPPRLVLAARLHVVRLRVGRRAPPRPEAPHGRAPPRGLPQLSLDQSLRLLPERALPGGREGRLLPPPSGRERLRRPRVEPAHGAGHGALRHRRLHEPRGRPLVPGEARRAARAGSGFVQAGLRRGDPGGRPLRERAHGRRDAQPLPASLPAGLLRGHAGARGAAARSPGPAARRRASSATRATGRGTRSARSSTWPTRSAAASPAR